MDRTVRPIRPVIVSVCAGSSCRKQSRTIVQGLEDAGAVRTVPCLGVCSGGVVVVERVDRVDVFSKIRKPSHLRALRELVHGRRELPDKLRSRRVSKKKRASALRRLRRRTDRAA